MDTYLLFRRIAPSSHLRKQKGNNKVLAAEWVNASSQKGKGRTIQARPWS
jgi:hypothetical protein